LMVLVPVGMGIEGPASAGASVASSICIAGYLPAVLAHYRIGFGKGRHGPRDNPEPMECVSVVLTLLLALASGAWTTCRLSGVV
jgi:hypothetical protein